MAHVPQRVRPKEHGIDHSTRIFCEGYALAVPWQSARAWD